MTKLLNYAKLLVVILNIKPINDMAQECQICGRGTTTGNNVSHSKVKTKKTLKINLQSKKIDNKKTKICTSCLKTYKKQTIK